MYKYISRYCDPSVFYATTIGMLFKRKKSSLPYDYNLSAGVTLIELLVVIAILSILSIALFMTINPIVQIERGRDSRRISDVKAMQSAFEQWYSLNDSVYDSTNGCANMAEDTIQGEVLPLSPGNAAYVCQAALGEGVDDSYCVCAELQNKTMQERFGNSFNNRCNWDTALAPGALRTHYCQSNLQ